MSTAPAVLLEFLNFLNLCSLCVLMFHTVVVAAKGGDCPDFAQAAGAKWDCPPLRTVFLKFLNLMYESKT
jgi:hypothetical protein